jgi:hypothetical protein
MYTLYWELAKYHFGSTLTTPECLSDLAKLMVQQGSGDPSMIACACAPDPKFPDRILREYYNCWWAPFDLSKNWDGQIDTIIKVFRLQAKEMKPAPIPPILSSRLLDLATSELRGCLKSMKASCTVLEVDTEETLKEINHTMVLINRAQALLEQVKKEEAAQAQAFGTDRLAKATGLDAQAAAALLRSARDPK